MLGQEYNKHVRKNLFLVNFDFEFITNILIQAALLFSNFLKAISLVHGIRLFFRFIRSGCSFISLPTYFLAWFVRSLLTESMIVVFFSPAFLWFIVILVVLCFIIHGPVWCAPETRWSTDMRLNCEIIKHSWRIENCKQGVHIFLTLALHT